MDYRRDYVLRLIEKMAQFIGALIKEALGLTTLDEFRGVDKKLDDAFRARTGFSRDAWLKLNVSDDQERCAAAGMLMYAQVQLWEHWPDYMHENDIAACKKSALMLLCKGAGEDAEAAKAVYANVRGLDNMELSADDARALSAFYETAGDYARAEDKLYLTNDNAAMHDFYGRMLTLPDDELRKGGLTRDEIERDAGHFEAGCPEK